LDVADYKPKRETGDERAQHGCSLVWEAQGNHHRGIQTTKTSPQRTPRGILDIGWPSGL
jgi:hypothetical protein